MLSSVSWALAHVAHVSMTTVLFSTLTSLDLHHTEVSMETAMGMGTFDLKSIGGVPGSLFWTENDAILVTFYFKSAPFCCVLGMCETEHLVSICVSFGVLFF